MALIRWQPFREIETLRRQFDDLFDELSGTNRESSMSWMPAVELEDKDENLILRVQLPGIEPKDLDVRVTREAVYMAGEHRQEQKSEERGLFRSEFRYGRFERVIPLPAHIQNDQVQSEYKNGILTLTLPKVQEAQRRVVKLNFSDSGQAIAGSENQAVNAKSENITGEYQTAPEQSEQSQQVQPS